MRPEEVLDARLVEGDDALADRLRPGAVRLGAEHLPAHLRHAHGGHQADAPEADYGDYGIGFRSGHGPSRIPGPATCSFEGMAAI